MPRSKTYFSELAGRCYLLIGLFMATFYVLGIAVTRQYLFAQACIVIVGAYWMISICYLAKKIADDFQKFYAAILRRMRLYSRRPLLGRVERDRQNRVYEVAYQRRQRRGHVSWIHSGDGSMCRLGSIRSQEPVLAEHL